MRRETPESPGSEPAAAEPTGARPRAPRWPAIGLLVAAVVLCYANSLRVPFLMDDPPVGAPLPFHRRPLVTASFWLNRALSGADPWSYHAFNVLVHLGCGLLLLGIVRRLAALAAPALAERTRAGLALVTALVWSCHPLQTAAVTYVSQRAESLGALFTLAVLHAFLRSTSSPHPRRWQALCLVALALGLVTKETVAVAPVLVLACDAVFVEPGLRAALRRRGRFHALLWFLMLVLAAVTIAPSLVGAPTAGFQLERHGPLAYARSQPGVLVHYLRLALWPDELCFDPGWPAARSAREIWLPGALIAALICASLWSLLRRSWIGFAGLSFFALLAPTSSIVPIQDLAFEHRMYLPLAAVVALAVAGGRWLLVRLGPAGTRLLPAAAALLVLACAARTVRRNHDYRTSVELWRLTAAQAPHHARAHANLGAALMDAGSTQEAVAALLEALRLDPRLWYAYANLGEAYRRLGQPALAARFLARGAELTAGRPPDGPGTGAR